VSSILDERAQIRLLTDTLRQVLAEERRQREEPPFEGQKTIERSADGSLSRVTTDLGHGRYRVQDLVRDEQGEIERVTSRIEQDPDVELAERAAELRKAAIMFAPDPYAPGSYRGS
jgi:hypothetical protein